MTRSPFVVSIAELRRERALPKPVAFTESVDWALELSRVLPDPPLDVKLELAVVSGGVLVTGVVRATVTHTCHRCLDEWVESIEVPVTQLFSDTGQDEDADYAMQGWEVDLEPVVRDEVLLALPLSPTCLDGCKGVVGAGESDLNTGTPADEGDYGSPFAVLKDLLAAGD